MREILQMWLILCNPNDASVPWAYEGLMSRGLVPLELVSSETLAYGVRWEHRLGNFGAFVEITLVDGRTIRSDQINGVLNRLVSAPSQHLLLIQPADREYVSAELTAFFMSWLYALPHPVLNRPTPQGLSGQWRDVSEWILMASRAGLPTPNYRRSSRDYLLEMSAERTSSPAFTLDSTVIVVRGHVVGASAPDHICKGCRCLAELAGTELLGIQFTSSPTGPWTFVGATTHPDLRLGGNLLLDVLTSVLKGETEDDE